MKTKQLQSLDEARAMLAEAQQQQTWLQNRIARYENRIRYVEQRQRRERTHRLITRGAAIESILPGVPSLTEIQFFGLMDEVFHLPNVAELVQRRLAQFAPDEAEGGETESPSTTSM